MNKEPLMRQNKDVSYLYAKLKSKTSSTTGPLGTHDIYANEREARKGD